MFPHRPTRLSLAIRGAQDAEVSAMTAFFSPYAQKIHADLLDRFKQLQQQQTAAAAARAPEAMASIGNGTISAPAPLASGTLAERTAQAQHDLSLKPRSGETQGQFTQRITTDPNLTANDVEQAGAAPFVPPSGRQMPADMRATGEFNAIMDSRMKRQQFLEKHGVSSMSEYWTQVAQDERMQRMGLKAPGTGIQDGQYVQPQGKEQHATAGQIKADLAQPLSVSYDSSHLLGEGPTPTDDSGNPIPDGKVIRTSDGAVFRHDANANQLTPVVWDAAKKDWQPRDAALEKASIHDKTLGREYSRLKAERQSIDSTKTMTDEQKQQARIKNEQAMNALAKGVKPEAAPQTLAEDFQANSAPSADGSVWYRGPDGKLTQISKPHHERAITPKEVADLRKTAQANVERGIPNKPGTTEAAHEADPKDVQAEFDKLVEDYVNVAEKISAARARAGGATDTPAQGASGGGGGGGPSQEDLEHTAKLHGLTVDEVKKKLGIQ